MPRIKQCLENVFLQESSFVFDVLVIDSGSSDGTVELVENYPVRLIPIQQTDFGHGRTRNLAAELARGDYIVYIVQDAVPYDDHWLDQLVRACEAEGVAGAYSREIPNKDCTPMTEAQYQILEREQPSQSVRNRLSEGLSIDSLSPHAQVELARFRNTSSCVRKKIVRAHPFPDIKFGEDIAWGKTILEHGYAIAYVSESIIYHSHERSLSYEFKRAYIGHRYLYEMFGYVPVSSLIGMLRVTIWLTFFYWKAIRKSNSRLSDKIRWMLLAPALSTARHIGQYWGTLSAHSDCLGRWYAGIDDLLSSEV